MLRPDQPEGLAPSREALEEQELPEPGIRVYPIADDCPTHPDHLEEDEIFIAKIVHNELTGRVWFVTSDGTQIHIVNDDHMAQISMTLGKIAWNS